MLRFALGVALAMTLVSAGPAIAREASASGHQQLVALFTDWRAFNPPAIVRGRPDYSASAMAAKAVGRTFRLEGIESQFSPFVNTRVEISGEVRSSQGGDSPVLLVEFVQRVASTCK